MPLTNRLPRLSIDQSLRLWSLSISSDPGDVRSSRHGLTGRSIMETFLIAIGVITLVGVVVFLFVIEPRRKIYER
jgi:predicted transcriptional regulator with HTH domain